MMKTLVLLLVQAIAFSPPVAATTLRFDALDETHPVMEPFIEGDYRVTGTAPLGLLGGNQALDIDIVLGPFSKAYNVTRIDGALFRWLSLDIRPINKDYLFPENPQTDVIISGFRQGRLQGNSDGTSQGGGETVAAPLGFTAIDQLTITGQLTQNARDKIRNTPFAADLHLYIDNITLGPAVVPVPAGITLLAGGLACLGLTRRIRRRSGPTRQET